MLRLKMFGGVSVITDDQPPKTVTTQRRRLALLALVGIAGENGISRDKIVGLLWPESDSESARHALTQSLYALRRDLRSSDLFDAASTDVRFNPAIITSDVAEFRALVREGELEQAMARYTGPFLDGYHIGDAPDFEHWVDDERAELARAAEHAIETLARAATTRGQHRRAADWWNRLAVLDPLSARVALALMDSLVAAGDRASALRHARVHETLLREQLQLPPDAAVRARAEQLRAEAIALVENVNHEPRPPLVAVRESAPVGATAAPARSMGAVAQVTAAVPYEVEREIGRGRSATVYLATDVKHRRPIALKVLHREATTPLARKRFARELMLLARLRHPHILPLFDSGNAGGALFYVTPYVEGGSVRTRLDARGALPWAEALSLAREVAEALDYAHRHNVIHREITPEHILIDNGHALVAGFGIARAIDTTFEVRLTEPGFALGSPAYASPEQARGIDALDGRSDIYSLGCVLAEMLSGVRPPSSEALHGDAMRAVLDRLPDAVRGIVATALASAPADRFQSADVLARALTVAQLELSRMG